MLPPWFGRYASHDHLYLYAHLPCIDSPFQRCYMVEIDERIA